MTRSTPTLVLLAALAGCDASSQPRIEAEEGVSIGQLRSTPGSSSTFLSWDFLATDALGEAIPCGEKDLKVSVRMSFDEGQSWTTISKSALRTVCADDIPPDLALTLDNSGSQRDALDQTRDGAKDLADGIVQLGGRMSAVRVSTTSNVESPLSADYEALDAAIDRMFVNDGWTALWDGLRMANETLGVELGHLDTPVYDDLQGFCEDHDRFGIVAFTNGLDNNSADQEYASSSSDGINTTRDDVVSLNVNGVQTPIHTIGLGTRTQTEELRTLSAETGGRSLNVRHPDDIPEAFALVRTWLESTTHVCAEAPGTGCGRAQVEITYTWGKGASAHSGTRNFNVNVPCPSVPATGRVTTILLTLNDPGIPQSVASTLVRNTAGWVTPTTNPRVAVLEDDNHHGEDVADTTYVTNLLRAHGYNTTVLREPAEGFEYDALEDYDILWLSNPGWPMDDVSTFHAMRQAASEGKGLVFQGDDMSWSMGNAFPLNSVNGMVHTDNGTSMCGKRTDNRQGASYAVTFGGGHPLTDDLEDVSVRYGNDIDHAQTIGNQSFEVAWARLDDPTPCRDEVPVVVGVDP